MGTPSSPSFVRSPEGNGCVKHFIRTLKKNLLWLGTFQTIEELQQALREFKNCYNQCLLIERHGHRSPSQSEGGRWTRSQPSHKIHRYFNSPRVLHSIN